MAYATFPIIQSWDIQNRMMAANSYEIASLDIQNRVMSANLYGIHSLSIQNTMMAANPFEIPSLELQNAMVAANPYEIPRLDFQNAANPPEIRSLDTQNSEGAMAIANPPEIQSLDIQDLEGAMAVANPPEIQSLYIQNLQGAMAAANPPEIQNLDIQNLQGAMAAANPPEIQNLDIQNLQGAMAAANPPEIQNLDIQNLQGAMAAANPREIQNLDIQNPQVVMAAANPSESEEKSALKIIPIRYLCKFGKQGRDEYAFTEPSGQAYFNDGSYVICDCNNHRLVYYSANHEYIRTIGQPPNLPPVSGPGNRFNRFDRQFGYLYFPNKAAICPLTQRIVITERPPSHDVQIFTKEGRFVNCFGDNILTHPRAVTVDERGTIIVIECKVMNLVLFHPDGALRQKRCLAQYLGFPNDVAARKGLIMISDNNYHCIKVFNYAGEILGDVGNENTFFPIGVSINYLNEIVVTSNHIAFTISVFNLRGRLLHTFQALDKLTKCYSCAISPSQMDLVVTTKDCKVHFYSYDVDFNHQAAEGHRHWQESLPHGLFQEARRDREFPSPSRENPTGPVVTTNDHQISCITQTSYTHVFGGFGQGYYNFQEPRGQAYANDGSYVICDATNHRLVYYSANHVFIGTIGQPPFMRPPREDLAGSDEDKMKFGFVPRKNVQNLGKICGFKPAPGYLHFPNRAAICPLTQNVVVTERPPSCRIQIFALTGEFIRCFRPGILSHPRGLTVDNQGTIIVIECQVMNLILFQRDGMVKGKYRLKEHLRFPNDVAARNRQIFISDNKLHCVKIFTYKGDYLGRLGGPEVTYFPIGVSVNYLNQVVVTTNHTTFNITIFDTKGIVRVYSSVYRLPQCHNVAIHPFFCELMVTTRDCRAYFFTYDPSVNHANICFRNRHVHKLRAVHG